MQNISTLANEILSKLEGKVTGTIQLRDACDAVGYNYWASMANARAIDELDSLIAKHGSIPVSEETPELYIPKTAVKLNYEKTQFTVNSSGKIGWCADWGEWFWSQIDKGHIVTKAIGGDTYGHTESFITQDFFAKCDIVHTYRN